MSKLQIKFTRKTGNQHHFEVRKMKIIIEDMVLFYARHSYKISLINSSYGWWFNHIFISLRRAEYACGEHLTTNEWYIENMKNNPDSWGRNATRNELPMTKGAVNIIDRAGSEYRVRYFEDNRAKDNLINYFMADIKNLSGYGIGLSYR